jgi:hypothetical protein
MGPGMPVGAAQEGVSCVPMWAAAAVSMDFVPDRMGMGGGSFSSDGS